MSFRYSPKIVTDGLILYYDGANPKCYISGNTTSNDLISNITGTLENGTGFSADNNGTWVFDGIDDYIDCGNNSIFNITQTLTLECWVNKSTKNYHHLISKFPISNCSYLLGTTPGGYIYFSRSTNGTNQGIQDTFNIDISDSNWHNVVASYNSITSTLIMSVDGKFQTSTILGDIFVTTTNVNIAKRTNVGQYFPCKIPIVKIYNKALTQEEITQNYNAMKSRFGL